MSKTHKRKTIVEIQPTMATDQRSGRVTQDVMQSEHDGPCRYDRHQWILNKKRTRVVRHKKYALPDLKIRVVRDILTTAIVPHDQGSSWRPVQIQKKTEGVHYIHKKWVCSWSVTSICRKNQEFYGCLLNIVVFTLVCEAPASMTTKV